MNNILLIGLVLVFGVLSFRINRWLGPRYRVVLLSALAAFFGVMAVVDSGHRFPYLLFVILSAVQLVRILYPKIKPPG